MEAMYHSAAGIVIHEENLEVCLQKGRRNRIIRNFGKRTGEILEMGKWLEESGCEIAGILLNTEIIGAVAYRLLQASSLEVLIVHERKLRMEHAKEDDVCDAQWFADLIRQGLVNATFIPDIDLKEVSGYISDYKGVLKDKENEVRHFYNILQEYGIRFREYIPDIEAKHATRVLEKLTTGIEITEADIIALGARNKTRDTPYEFAALLNLLPTDAIRKLLSGILDHLKIINELLETLEKLIEDLIMLEFAKRQQA